MNWQISLYLTLPEDIFVALWFGLFQGCVNIKGTDLLGGGVVCFMLYLPISIVSDWKEDPAVHHIM